MPATATKAGVARDMKRALVVGNKSKEFFFLETMFINRGHIVKMFENINDAKAWLFEK